MSNIEYFELSCIRFMTLYCIL